MRTKLAINFKRGPKQSFQANKYFVMLADDIVSRYLQETRLFRYIFVDNEDQEALCIRYWAKEQASQMEMFQIRDWIYELSQDIDDLEKKPSSVERVNDLVKRWMMVRDSTRSFMFEQLYPGTSFKSEDSALSVLVTGGRLRLLSSPNVTYIEEGANIYGLSVARKGSYAIEVE